MKILELSDKKRLVPLHETAFGDKAGPVIAQLVADLLDDRTADPVLSLAASDDSGLVGHILFTRAQIMGTDVSVRLLAPLAVSPRVQGLGIGQALIQEGLDRLKASGVDLVFVLGHPGYYPKAGFTPAGAKGFTAPYPIPEKDAPAWMVTDLSGTCFGRVSGKIQCARALDRPEHWQE